MGKSNMRTRSKKRRTLTSEVLEERHLLAGDLPIINEFMASNSGTIDDGNGQSSDWIEIYNPTATEIDLAGWHLTDDPKALA